LSSRYGFGDHLEFDGTTKDFLTILYEETQQSPELVHAFGNKTHCAGTVRTIVEIFKKKNYLHNEQQDACNYDERLQNVLAHKLFSKPETNSPKNTCLFRVNICAGAHVFLIIKQHDGWIVLQAWDRRFSLLQWLGQDRWQDQACHEEFLEYGNGQVITQEQLDRFICDMLDIGRNKLERLKKAGTPVPLELEITVWDVV